MRWKQTCAKYVAYVVFIRLNLGPTHLYLLALVHFRVKFDLEFCFGTINKYRTSTPH